MASPAANNIGVLAGPMSQNTYRAPAANEMGSAGAWSAINRHRQRREGKVWENMLREQKKTNTEIKRVGEKIEKMGEEIAEAPH